MCLLETTDDQAQDYGSINEALLKELSKSLFTSNKYRIFFEQGHPRATVSGVEDQLAEELAETYRTIQERYHDPQVQRLNSLLSA
jgi:hypothetical protein